MRINYNTWFYKQHHYTQGTRDGVTSYNDTKWNNIAERMKTLTELQSRLITEQPFGVVSNYTGFDKLISLMDRSDYTFHDINDALIDTYNMSLKNAMSGMVVNTHAVISRCKNTDASVKNDPVNAKYYIVDVPYQQLHFGDRDEMIRQNLQKMFATAWNNYVDMETFYSDEIASVLGFGILCTGNGLICNDWLIAIDDKGFHFKIAWTAPYDVEFIIYKLDKCTVRITDMTMSDLNLGKIKTDVPVGSKCIIDLFDPERKDSMLGIPNFGEMTENGMSCLLQSKTKTQFNQVGTNHIKCVVYALKYFHEVPGVYPAYNYYDMMYTQPVYTENGDDVVVDETSRVIGLRQNVANMTELCTPPISLDRQTRVSFSTIIGCVKLRSTMMNAANDVKQLGEMINSNNTELSVIREKTVQLLGQLKTWYQVYLRGAIVTSLIPFSNMNVFVNTIDSFQTLLNQIDKPDATIVSIRGYAPELLYGDQYAAFVNRVCEPFNHGVFSEFTSLQNDPNVNIEGSYFTTQSDSTRFNRPISEQCFITLKFSHTYECWVFNAPLIQHFKGIGNTFYINSELDGDELFRFFVLYTDTLNPDETDVEPFAYEDVIDFDRFSEEVDKHIGYIRYWNVENHIRKLAMTLYDQDDVDTQTQVLSQMLRHKLNGEEFVDTYPSDINYEPSNASTDHVDANETDDRGPFSVNFLFYTVQMLFDNKDQLLSYFMNRLTKQSYANRYSDIDVSTILNHAIRFPINYTTYTVAPTSLDMAQTTLVPDVYTLFYGVPTVFDTTGQSVLTTPFPYTFHYYDASVVFPSINDSKIDTNYTTQFNGTSRTDHHATIHVIKSIMKMMMEIRDGLSFVLTDYKSAMMHNQECALIYQSLQKQWNTLQQYMDEHNPAMPGAVSFDSNMNALKALCDVFGQIAEFINTVRTSIVGNQNIFTVYNRDVLAVLRNVYVNTGYDDYAADRIRALYMHLKKLNDGLSLGEFIDWLNHVDFTTLSKLDTMIATNSSYSDLSIPEDYFRTLTRLLEIGRDTALGSNGITGLQTLLVTLTNDQTFANIMQDVVYPVSQNVIYDLYGNGPITFTPTAVSAEPMYVVASTGQYEFVFKVHGEINGNGTYDITEVTPICEYAFEETYLTNGEIVFTNATVYDATGTSIGTIDTITMKPIRVSNTSDDTSDVFVLPDTQHTLLEFNNIHETNIPVNQTVATVQDTMLHYELLNGNHFKPLDHTHVMTLDVQTNQQIPIDVVDTPNTLINQFVREEYGSHLSPKLYVKPSGVDHVTVNISMTSIHGKYFVGQILYVTTIDENKFTFPIIVTKIDHSIEHGMIEAIVDAKHTPWFVAPMTSINYMRDPIPCRVLGDNISNFMNEFSNASYSYYPIPETVPDDQLNEHTLLGDPIHVTTNPTYTYTRLAWMFSPSIPNRFPDEKREMYQFTYIGYGSILKSDKLTIQMTCHDFNTMTQQELYPVLRDEPNDHAIHKTEQRTFQAYYDDASELIETYASQYEEWKATYDEATTESARMNAKIQMDECQLKIKQQTQFMRRLENYMQRPEQKTTWYNVDTYDDAELYIKNGRAHMTHIPTPLIRDIVYTDKIEVWMYDWEHKVWINPNTYTVEIVVPPFVNNPDQLDLSTTPGVENQTALTTQMQYQMVITPNDASFESKQLLVYLVYKKSDVYDSIYLNTINADVRFKTYIATTNVLTTDLYGDVRIRKHYDTNEVYRLDDYRISNGKYLVKRIRRSGKYSDASIARWSDFTIKSNGQTYTVNDIDVFIAFPFKNITSSMYASVTKYQTSIITDIDNFTDGETVTLICVQDNANASYDGNTSSIVMKALLQMIGDTPTVSIIASNTGNMVGTFICTVAKDPTYNSCGGLIRVTTSLTRNVAHFDDTHDWYRLEGDILDRVIPDDFVLMTTIAVDESTTLEIHNHYVKDTTDALSSYMYYYDDKYNVRYPISNVRAHRFDERLEIDLSLNPSVHKIKSNYIGICRFSMQKIPAHGFIDLTGYLPTPLSRTRYEFWVNGRCITNSDKLTITSPTTIQLQNLTSLRNLEIVELVDDVDTNPITEPIGPLYVDLEGNTFASYQLMMLSNSNIRYQYLRYRFYGNLNNHVEHTHIQHPNNFDIEPDILSYLITDVTPSDYRDLFNIPSINGVPLQHVSSEDIGFMEIPTTKVCEEFARTWKKEITTNPLFTLSYADLMHASDYINLHYTSTVNGNFIYTTGTISTYFTVYFTDVETDPITKAVSIIPMVSVGTFIALNSVFSEKWVHITIPDVSPIQLPIIEDPSPDVPTTPVYVKNLVTGESVGFETFDEMATYLSDNSSGRFELVFTTRCNETVTSQQFMSIASIVKVTINKDIFPDDPNTGVSTFYGCANLTTVTISNDVVTIPNGAFASCTALTSFTCPSELRTIGNGAFSNCTSISQFEFNDKLTTLGSGAISNVPATNNITIPGSLQTIPSGGFGSVNFAEITIAEGVQTLSPGSFYGNCTTRILRIPSTATVANGSMGGLTNLSEIIINKPEGSVDTSGWGYAGSPTITWVG